MKTEVRSKSGSLPEVGYVRLSQILEVFPVSKSTWWQGVKDGKFPQSVKLGLRTTAWRVEEIKALLENGLNWKQDASHG